MSPPHLPVSARQVIRFLVQAATLSVTAECVAYVRMDGSKIIHPLALLHLSLSNYSSPQAERRNTGLSCLEAHKVSAPNLP